MTTYTLTHLDRPWTQNQERTLHHLDKAAKVKEWRQAFRVLAIQAHLPRLERVTVTAQSHLRTNRSRDVAAEMPAVKAAIDGALVDSGALVDDTPDHLTSLTFLAPILGAERDALELRIEVLG